MLPRGTSTVGTWVADSTGSDLTERTMAGALQDFVGQCTTDVVLLNAGSLLIMAPTIVVFLFFRRHFVKAVIAGAVEG
ncbi:hypothetical protein OEB99_04625 [Actinotalea sp. M2MS4P-6]|uniref:hypothetical protein n=1 Tax=Actinotalea sp. M2MS4P-6 TaxID=2983762 RepID=UPI0021E38835|nr:hypothetical protein [Actinotalea sp. M2MS4P-6]MCV2393585.1 hypothetical protein [Actinotalea sp. M2MS4P-6]